MPYLFKQTFKLSELAPVEPLQRVIILVEPEHYLAALYRKYLEAGEYLTHALLNYDYLPEAVQQLNPQALILNVDSPQLAPRASVLVRRLRARHPALPMVSVAMQLKEEELRRLINCGITGHIDRLRTRPMDVVHVMNGILH